jgi:hypothetical protein
MSILFAIVTLMGEISLLCERDLGELMLWTLSGFLSTTFVLHLLIAYFFWVVFANGCRLRDPKFNFVTIN